MKLPRRTTIPALLVCVLTSGLIRSHAGLLVNESFETPALATNGTLDLWDQNGQVGASGTLTGWGLGEFNYFSAATLNPTTVLINNPGAPAGSQYLGFNVGQWDAGGTVFQSFTATPNMAYNLTYQIGASGGAAGTVSMRVRAYDGATVLAETTTSRNTLGWGQDSLSFTAGSGSSSIMIEFLDITPNAGGNNTDLLLDNVSLTAVPEPSTYGAVFGLGLAGLGVFRRLRAARPVAAALG